MIRRLKIPEVVQTNAIDCGPASLKCVFDGYRIPVNYDKLRKLCQKEFDGANLEDMETLAINQGMKVKIDRLPIDHLLLREAGKLPAIVEVRLPDGSDHFVVLWRRHGPFVQVMDPATGRRWPTGKAFLDEIKIHWGQIETGKWRKWAGSEIFQAPLRRRLRNLKVPGDKINNWIEMANADPSWKSVARLDASCRMIQRVVDSGAMKKGKKAVDAVESFFQPARRRHDSQPEIPDEFWLVRPKNGEPQNPNTLMSRSARIIRILGPNSSAASREGNTEKEKKAFHLPRMELFRSLKADGFLSLGIITLGLGAEAFFRIIEALFFRSLLDIGSRINSNQRFSWMLVGFVFFLIMTALIYTANHGLLCSGRNFEARLRISFLGKLMRLGVRYLKSHSISDLAERSHNIQSLRLVVYWVGQILRNMFGLIATAAAIIWLDPRTAPLALMAVFISFALPLKTSRMLTERDMRVRTYGGSLTTYYLDALLGLIPCRTHGAGYAIRREHESLLNDWTKSSLSLQQRTVLIDGIQCFFSFFFAIAILLVHITWAGESGGILLILYWALHMRSKGELLSRAVPEYAAYRSRLFRLLEPIAMAEEATPGKPEKNGEKKALPPVALEIRDVSVKFSGHPVLTDLSFNVQPGEHVGIVGASGAGKSTVMGLLLGFYEPSRGTVLVDGVPLDPDVLAQLRQETAWVDPSVQLWNRSFLENLRYGAPADQLLPIGRVIQEADLHGVIEQLPDGLQTSLGEGGGFLSGGEGQRTRLGRGLLRRDARLVILDEPFRGLDRHKRHELLVRARQWWQNATLVCVTHDVGETVNFKRVLVIEQGRLIEDDSPQKLLEKRSSRYKELLDAENEVRRSQWSGLTWRRLKLVDGTLLEEIKESE